MIIVTVWVSTPANKDVLGILEGYVAELADLNSSTATERLALRLCIACSRNFQLTIDYDHTKTLHEEG